MPVLFFEYLFRSTKLGYHFKPEEGNQLVSFPMRCHGVVGWTAVLHFMYHVGVTSVLFCPGLKWWHDFDVSVHLDPSAAPNRLAGIASLLCFFHNGFNSQVFLD